MKLNYELTLEQSQKLIMTPELRQAIQLLQYTSLELQEYILREIEENPLLELEDSIEEPQDIIDGFDEIDWKEYIENYDDISYKEEIDKDVKSITFENFFMPSQTLKEYLLEQLSMVSVGQREYKIAEYIIQNIDSNGYLTASTLEIAEALNVSEHEVEVMLGIVQTFEPEGVGARNLKECLLLQLRDRKDSLIINIVENYLEDIALNKLSKIATELNIEVEEVQKYADEIKLLEPKPGRSFGGDNKEVKYIIPDAKVEKIDGEYVVIINEIAVPKLNINSFYKGLIKNSDEATSQFLQEKLNSAVWIIKSIEQRKQTLYKVIDSIVKFQIDFFEKGGGYLKPLTLKDVADDIKMHESTVSRATNGKYIQTAKGIYELKYFFSQAIKANEGLISSDTVKNTIREIIDKEDSKKPMSDQQIADKLEQMGISISRRTVAKYREELSIPSSKLRKRF
ncbi:RNA polymerase factor sigma-54 [Soehngenia saccharolytica]|nr:RNA polymerase factor sigma-54 [Soehngenia saccharolytica]